MRRIAGKLCPIYTYSHSPHYSVTYYVGRVEGEASVPRVEHSRQFEMIGVGPNLSHGSHVHLPVL